MGVSRINVLVPEKEIAIAAPSTRCDATVSVIGARALSLVYVIGWGCFRASVTDNLAP